MSLPQMLFIPNKTPTILMLPLMEECRLTWLRMETNRSLGPKSCCQQDHLQSHVGFLMALGVSCWSSSTCGLWAAGGEGKLSCLSCIGWEVSKENEIICDPPLAERSLPLAAC